MLFFDAKKHPFEVLFFYGVRLIFTRIESFAYVPPVLHNGGHSDKFQSDLSTPLVWPRKPLLNLSAYPNATYFLPNCKPWGFAPNPTLTCEAAGACGKPYPPTPTVSVGSIPRRQG